MALLWTGTPHDTPAMVGGSRDYDKIAEAGATARDAVWRNDLSGIAAGVRLSYAVQRAEGMDPLPGDPKRNQPIPGAIAWKYCGGGFGGYAVYLFAEAAA